MSSIGKELIGHKVEAIKMNKEYLVFKTDKGVIAYGVDGDCCSHSYFYDFYGVENLLKNGEIKNVTAVNLLEGDFNSTRVINPIEQTYINNGELKLYGFQITTEGEFGEVTSVFSFRNSSNGYYGGGMNLISVVDVFKWVQEHQQKLTLVTKDIIELQ
jgi:hypothetical protein